MLTGRWVSPDGRRITISGIAADGGGHLWVRSLDSLSTEMLPGTLGAISPFWSPDSKSIAFFADGKLKKIDLSGGPSQILCDAPAVTSGTWNREGTILFQTSAQGPLYRVNAAGGEPKPATELDPLQHETSHGAPGFLPDEIGRASCRERV